MIRPAPALALIAAFALAACGGGDGPASTPEADAPTVFPNADAVGGGDPGPGPTPDAGGPTRHPGAGEVVVTELMINPEAVEDDLGEWLELHNPTGTDHDLAGCILRSGGDDPLVIEGALPLPAGGYVVLGREEALAVNGGAPVDYAYGAALTLSNGTDDVSLTCSGVLVDAVAWDDGATFPDPAGASLSLDPASAPDAAANDDGSRWCEGTTAYGDGDRGTPGAANAPCSDPCDAVSCVAPPAPACEGTTAVVFGGPGTCADGRCDYPTLSQTDCAADGELCLGGKCVPDTTPVNPGPGGAYFTEIMQNPAAVDDALGEWVEVRNAGTGAIDLAGCQLVSGPKTFTLPVDAPLLVGGGGYVVLGLNGDAATNGGVTVDAVYEGVGLANGEDDLALICGGVTVDAVAWDGGPAWPDPDGASMQLDPAVAGSAGANDAGAAWCEGQTAYGAGDLGTPGGPNDACPDPCDSVVCNDAPAPSCAETVLTTWAPTGTCLQGACDYAVADVTDCSPGSCVDGACVAPVPTPQPGELIITEIMQNPGAVADSAGEWFELHNPTSGELDLASCAVATAGDAAIALGAGGSLPIPSGAYLVFAVDGDSASNGGLTPDGVVSSLSLTNGSDGLAVTCGGVLVDAVSWDDGETFPDPDGAAMALDPTGIDAATNDFGPAWCVATSSYGAGDLGTPGAPNDACPDRCAGIVCDLAPDPTCASGSVETWGATGTCAFGHCSYQVTSSTPCGGGQLCQAGACVAAASAAPAPAAAGDLIITEIMQNPAAVPDPYGEWFEVYNATVDDLELSGCVLTSDGDPEHVVAELGSLVVPADALWVLGSNFDLYSNGYLLVDYEYAPTTRLDNAADSLALTCGGVLVDAVAWDGGPAFPDPTGASMAADVLDAAGNDDGAAWCPSTTVFGDGDKGTPGDLNDPCP